MLVTIITIVYNGEKYIEDTIRSVGAQTYPNIEYIIVDGGSTDSTPDIIGKYRDTVTTLIMEKDEGISDAFNKGLRLAKGEIIGIINADDWYEPDTVEKVVAAMPDHDIVYGRLRLWKDDRPDFVCEGDHNYLVSEMTINHPTVFARKEVYDRWGGFDKKYKCAMDYDLVLRFWINGCRFRYIPAILANMRWGGLSDNRWMLGCRETLSIKNKYLPHRRWRNRLYFYKHILAISAPRILQQFGLHFVTRFYRTNFSRVKKVYQ
ncbi:MAG TPA: glycosyltransferase family 2 protein [Puia sp.]|jgi:glycosyltransferase involved in cell wall biosynthesis|nr:glycosyltransferase family 2 protein [Puia sp.]